MTYDDALAAAVSAAANSTTSAGVASIDVGGEVLLDYAWGLADRRHGIAMTRACQLAIASGSKTFTALAVMSLVADGTLALETTARSVLGADLPLIADDVTIEHLLAHRSGIGEYFDDDADASDYLLPVPAHRLNGPEDYLPILDGHPTAFPAGSDFFYCNGGYVVLSLIAERASGVGFHQLVTERVFAPAGMADTAYLRSDDLPGRAAVGYVEVGGHWRTNVHHLPVIGGGDGGAYTTTTDLSRFWAALFAGRIVPAELVEQMTSVISAEEEGGGYGLGFWLSAGREGVQLVGEDTGVSFWSEHEPSTGRTRTVIATTDSAAWDVVSAILAQEA